MIAKKRDALLSCNSNHAEPKNNNVLQKRVPLKVLYLSTINNDMLNILYALKHSKIFDTKVIHCTARNDLDKTHQLDTFNLCLIDGYSNAQNATKILGDLASQDQNLRTILLVGDETDETLAMQATCCLHIDDASVSVLDNIMGLLLREQKIADDAALKYDALEEQNSKYTATIGTLAHEVGTLTSIARTSIMLNAQQQDTDYSAEIAHQIEHLYATSQTILSNSDMIEPVQKDDQVNMFGLCERIRRLAEPMVAQSGCRLTLIEPERDTSVKLNDILFIQVATNLISNAVKYSADGAKIGVTILNNASSIHMIVSNSGSQITKAMLHALRLRGKRGKQTDNLPGHGLGLSIVDDFLEKMGGVLRIESGKNGTFMHVTIPVKYTKPSL